MIDIDRAERLLAYLNCAAAEADMMEDRRTSVQIEAMILNVEAGQQAALKRQCALKRRQAALAEREVHGVAAGVSA